MKRQTICLAIFVMLAAASHSSLIEDVSKVANSLISALEKSGVCPCKKWPCDCLTEEKKIAAREDCPSGFTYTCERGNCYCKANGGGECPPGYKYVQERGQWYCKPLSSTAILSDSENCLVYYPPLDPDAYYGKTGCAECESGYYQQCTRQWISRCFCMQNAKIEGN